MPSKIPQVTDYLVALAAGLTATTLAGVHVQDGPPTAQLLGLRKVLVVGGEWQPSDIARPGATGTQEPSMGNASRNESILVACSAFSQSGDTGMKILRDEAFAVEAAFENAVIIDRTLGGLCYGDARVAAVDNYRPIQNERGAAAIVDFTITATALLWDG
jgi:hypothetical protein